jgi:hypothetical protein
MALIAFQETILRLYTDRSFQRRFLTDRKKTLRGVRLTEREEAALMNLPEKGLGIFYRELFHKRREFMTVIARRSGENAVVASGFYVRSPVIMFRDAGGERVVETSVPVFLILERLAGSKLTFRGIMNVHTASPLTGLKDLFALIVLITRYGLMGKTLKVM